MAAGAQAALSVCLSASPAGVGPAHRVSVLPAPGCRPPLPSAVTDARASSHSVPPPLRNWRGPPAPAGLSSLSALCCCLNHRPRQRRVVRLGRGHQEPETPGRVWQWGPSLPSFMSYRQNFPEGPGGASRTWAETRPVFVCTCSGGPFLMGTQTSSQSVNHSPANRRAEGCEELVRPHQAGPPDV